MKKLLAMTSLVAPALTIGMLSFGGPMILLILLGIVGLGDPASLFLILLAALFSIILA